MKSEEITELIKALIKAQGEFEPLQKDKINPYFNSRYSSLDSVHKSTQKALRNNGLAIIQTFHEDNLVTTLIHETGQYISGSIKMMTVKNDPQSAGSSITYYRRYCYCAMVGVVPDEDDDGNAGSEDDNKKNEEEIKLKKIELKTKLSEDAIEGLRNLQYGVKACHAFCEKFGWDNDKIKAEINKVIDSKAYNGEFNYNDYDKHG